MITICALSPVPLPLFEAATTRCAALGPPIRFPELPSTRMPPAPLPAPTMMSPVEVGPNQEPSTTLSDPPEIAIPQPLKLPTASALTTTSVASESVRPSEVQISGPQSVPLPSMKMTGSARKPAWVVPSTVTSPVMAGSGVSGEITWSAGARDREVDLVGVVGVVGVRVRGLERLAQRAVRVGATVRRAIGRGRHGERRPRLRRVGEQPDPVGERVALRRVRERDPRGNRRAVGAGRVHVERLAASVADECDVHPVGRPRGIRVEDRRVRRVERAAEPSAATIQTEDTPLRALANAIFDLRPATSRVRVLRGVVAAVQERLGAAVRVHRVDVAGPGAVGVECDLGAVGAPGRSVTPGVLVRFAAPVPWRSSPRFHQPDLAASLPRDQAAVDESDGRVSVAALFVSLLATFPDGSVV